MAQVAREMLAPTSEGGLGQGSIALVRYLPPPPPANPWDPPAQPTRQVTPLDGVVRGVAKELIGAPVETGGQIVASDVQILVAPWDGRYDPADVIEVGHAPVTVLKVENIPAAGTVCAVRFIARGRLDARGIQLEIEGTVATSAALTGELVGVGYLAGGVTAAVVGAGALAGTGLFGGGVTAVSGAAPGGMVGTAAISATIAAAGATSGAMSVTGWLASLTTGALVSSITFTRASTGRYFDSAGILQSAANNVPRFEYDPATLTRRGFLFEGQRTNLLLRSEEFDNAAWIKGSDITPTANAITAPNGTTTADMLTINASGGGIYQTVSVTANTAYTLSMWVRLGTLAAANFKMAFRDDTAGSFIAADVVPAQTPTASGWTRVTYTLATPAGCALLRIYPFRNAAATSGTLYVWGAQVEAGTYATSYISTAAAQATRAADVASMALGAEFNAAGQTAVLSVLFSRNPSDGIAGKRLWAWDDGSSNNRVGIVVSSGGVLQATCVIGGVVVNVNGPTLSANTLYKVAFGFASGVLRLVVNGTAYTDGAPSGSPSGLTTRRLSGSVEPYAWLDGMSEFPRLLSAAEMQALTA